MKHCKILLVFAAVLSCGTGFSQQVLAGPHGAGVDGEASVRAVVKPVPVETQKPLTGRWLDLNALSYTSRYRNTANWHGRRLFQFSQEKYVATGRFKFDSEGKYSLGFRMSSGRYFNWSFADLIGGQYKDSVVAARAYKTAQESAALKVALALDPNGAVYQAGIPSRGGYFDPREFYFRAAPVKAVTFEVGSLGIEHGQNTEITSFDDDGYVSGERVQVNAPKQLFFDKIEATFGFLGSPLTPDFFGRAGDMGHFSYAQYLVEKQAGPYAKASVDFTLANHTHTMREAVALQTPAVRVIDAMRLEMYQRTNDVAISGINFAAGSGFAVSADKQLCKRVKLEAGYADIDERYAAYGGSIYLATVGFAWNGDSYETGKREFTRADVKLGKGVSAVGFYTDTIVAPTIGHNKEGWSAGLSFDLKTLVNTKARVF